VLVSKELLTGAKISERFNHVEIQNSIIEE
jgi:hypothetical protein